MGWGPRANLNNAAFPMDASRFYYVFPRMLRVCATLSLPTAATAAPPSSYRAIPTALGSASIRTCTCAPDWRLLHAAQIYGLRFIARYADWNPLPAPYEAGSAWGNLIPDSVDQFPYFQRLLLRVSPLLSLSAKSIAGVARGLRRPDPNWSPNDPDWLLLKRDRWPEPFRTYASDFERILGLYLTSTRSTVVVLKSTPKGIVQQERKAAVGRLMARGYLEDDIDPRALQRLMSEISSKFGDCPRYDECVREAPRSGQPIPGG